MAALTPVLLPTPFEQNIANTPVDPGFVAGDLGGDTYPLTGKEIILVRSIDAGAQTLTVTSQPAAATQRTGDITNASIPAGAIRAFQLFHTNGWIDPSGFINLTVSAVTLELAALRLR